MDQREEKKTNNGLKGKLAKGIEFVCLRSRCSGAAWVAQRFSAAFSPGYDPGDLGSSPTSGSLHGACLSPRLSLSLNK